MSSEQQRQDQHQKILEILEVQEEICNDWERDFLNSVAVWTESQILSAKQHNVFSRLWTRACALPERKLRKSDKPKKQAQKLSPEEVWARTPTPQRGDEEFLF